MNDLETMKKIFICPTAISVEIYKEDLIKPKLIYKTETLYDKATEYLIYNDWTEEAIKMQENEWSNRIQLANNAREKEFKNIFINNIFLNSCIEWFDFDGQNCSDHRSEDEEYCSGWNGLSRRCESMDSIKFLDIYEDNLFYGLAY